MPEALDERSSEAVPFAWRAVNKLDSRIPCCLGAYHIGRLITAVVHKNNLEFLESFESYKYLFEYPLYITELVKCRQNNR